MVTLIVLAMVLIPYLIIGGVTALFWKRKRRSVLRWCAALYVLTAILVIFGVGPYLAAWGITHSGTRLSDRQLKDTPADYQLRYEDVVFSARDSLRLRGWFIPPGARHTLLICTHGLFRNRVEMLGRIVPLVRAGYGALLYDSRSHGTSDRGVTSLGYYERNDVLGAIQYVRQRYQDAPEQPRIVLFGVSMGAVATLEAAAESKDYEALILDSPFASIEQAVKTDTWMLMRLPRYTFPPLFMYWFRRLAGFDGDRPNAFRAIAKVAPVPILLITSEGDERIGPQVARDLYSESRAPVRKLEVFGREVPHGAAARLYPDRYSALLFSFLESTFVDQSKR
jgi:pimeloyl-ACP methyl ester carboxylesterase